MEVCNLQACFGRFLDSSWAAPASKTHLANTVAPPPLRATYPRHRNGAQGSPVDKNGTKSNLIKCYVERISEDCVDVVKNKKEDSLDWICPTCETRFGKDALIHGRPAIKLVGGKTQMTKKQLIEALSSAEQRIAELEEQVDVLEKEKVQSEI